MTGTTGAMPPTWMAVLTKTGAGTKAFDFSKIANNGTTLAAGAALGTAATDWACTKDNITGLTWEVKTTSGLRSNVNSYTWYSTDAASNGASSASGGGGVDASNGAVRLVRSGQPMDSYPVLLKTNQTIAFGVAPTVVFGSTGTVSASGGASGNAVTFTSATTGVCTISGSTVTGVTAGTCTIAADQAGNGNYNAAAQATQSFSVGSAGLASQTISFGAAPAVVVSGTGTVSATGGASGNAVTFASTTTGICSISGNTVTGVTAGTCTIAANQVGNGSYSAAPQATQSFAVGLPGAVTAIPTLSEWGMIMLAGMLGLLGVFVMTQRSTTVRPARKN